VDLNNQQRKAVLHGKNILPSGSPPLLVIAGAGSGKTKVIAARVAQLLLSGVDPTRILLLTFSRRASREMVNRSQTVTKSNPRAGGSQFPWAGTFHSVAVKLLRQYGRRIGISPSFTIIDRADAEDLMGLVRHDLGLADKSSLFPKKDTCLAIYSLQVNCLRSLKAVLREKFPSCRRWRKDLKRLFRAYEAAKRAQNVLDYDDLLRLWLELLKNQKFAKEIGGLFDHVLVDEYQDTNRLQAQILLALKPDGRGLTVVGDDAQSIYSFRAAEVRNILDFPKLFDPEPSVSTLEQNYRSTQPILRACNKVIGLAKERFTKNLFSKRRSAQKPFMTTVRDGTAQAKHVADQILKAHEAGVPLKSQAVLFRASHHSGQLEIELAKRDIPFVKWGGIKFLDAAHIKDALSVLRWCQNPGDRIAAFRTLQLLPGIGPQTASLIFEKTARRTFVKDLKAVTPPKAALRDWPGFSKLVDRTWREREAWPAEFQSLCKWIGPQVRRKYDDNIEGRLNDLDQLAQIAATFPSRQAFLTELAIDPPEVAGGQLPGDDNDGDHLILSTIHSAKGQEWERVTVLNVIDGCIPHARAGNNRDDLEEERRLLYVAMTRAKDELDLIVPQFHFSIREAFGGDMEHLTKRSRIIPKRFNKHFECRVGRIGRK
ncbi:MAG: ATP-dependent helicase, partial [Alphaproteobacteria bacterium]|nr:ATP-dependent helicase [Alphaproteobacteria bacterium]